MTRATFNKGATLIALRPIPALGGRAFEPGDVVKWRHLALGERRVGQMIDQHLLGELSQETLDFAVKQRPDGSLPRGLTEPGLEAMGISLKAPPAPKPPPKPELEVKYDGEESYKGFTLRRQKRGAIPYFDIFDADGARVNPGGMLKGKKAAQPFVDNLLAEKARLEAAAGPKPDSSEEKADSAAGGEENSTGTDQATSEKPGGGDPAPADPDLKEPGYGDE